MVPGPRVECRGECGDMFGWGNCGRVLARKTIGEMRPSGENQQSPTESTIWNILRGKLKIWNILHCLNLSWIRKSLFFIYQTCGMSCDISVSDRRQRRLDWSTFPYIQQWTLGVPLQHTEKSLLIELNNKRDSNVDDKDPRRNYDEN